MAAEAQDRFIGSPAAPLEYWYWKFQAADLAFLVDFIVRRKANAGEVRVSLWDRGRGRVARITSDAWSADADGVSIAGGHLRERGSTGSVDDISWDLNWRAGQYRVRSRPDVFGPLHPLDMEHFLLPDARFSGWVSVGAKRFPVDDVPGLLMRYWGRRLSDRWCWISATEFGDDPDRRIEVLVGRSSLWGQERFQMPAAYLWTVDRRGSPELTLSPVNGIIRARRDGDRVEITSLRMDGRRHRLTCRADSGDFNDLGEGIRQTLLADLTVDGHDAVAGTAGLEFRG